MPRVVPVLMLLGVQHACTVCTLCMFVILYGMCVRCVHGTVILQCV